MLCWSHLGTGTRGPCQKSRSQTFLQDHQAARGTDGLFRRDGHWARAARHGTGPPELVLPFTSPRDGKRARATIGTYPATSLAAAAARRWKPEDTWRLGNDPRLVLAGQATAGMTVAGLVDAYLADPEKAALRSKGEIERRLRKNVVPVIGEIKLAELRRRDVRNVTDTILKRKRQGRGDTVFEDVRAVVRWAVQNEYLDANPLDGMGKPAEATSSNRVLSDDEIRTLWQGCPMRSRAPSNASRLSSFAS